MRKLWMVFAVFLMAALNAFSQPESDSAVYSRGIAIMNKAITADNYLESAFYFEGVTREFPDQWLAYYYTGLSYIRAAQQSLVSKTKDKLLDRSQFYIDKAFGLKPGESELIILQAFHYQARLMVDPSSRAINYAPKAETLLRKALQTDPDNPRAYFLMGSNIYYTPPMFKGGPKNALPVFMKAKEKYGVFVSSLPFMPEWGEKENLEMIRLCKNAKN